MKKIFIIILILPVLCFAFDFNNGGIRNAAMGGTGISSTNDASASVWNPSLLGKSETYNLITDSRPYILQLDNDNIYQNFTYFNFPVEKVGTFAVSGELFNSNSYDEGKFGLHYGLNIYRKKVFIGFGLNDHFVNFSDLEKNKNAIDGDFGFQYCPSKYFSFGFLIENLQRTDLAIDENNHDKLPRIYGFGWSINPKNIILTGDLKYEQYSNLDNIVVSVGAEFSIADYLHLRAGFNNYNFTGGFGIDIFSKKWMKDITPEADKLEKISFFDISVDYAFEYPVNFTIDRNEIEIGNEIESQYGDHFLGLRLDFGKKYISDEEFKKYFPITKEAVTDTIFIEIEKIKIDTVYKEKTIYDTITVVREIVDPSMVAEAINEGKRKIKEDTTDDVNLAANHLTKALRMYYSQDFSGAIAECRKAIRIAPNFALSYIRLGSIFYRIGDVDEAMYWWKRAKEIDPNNDEVDRILEEAKNGVYKFE